MVVSGILFGVMTPKGVLGLHFSSKPGTCLCEASCFDTVHIQYIFHIVHAALTIASDSN